MGPDDVERGTGRATKIDRTGRVVLHPLTQIGVGVFVSVGISRSELMMHVLGYGKRSQCQEESDEAEGKPTGEPTKGDTRSHGMAL